MRNSTSWLPVVRPLALASTLCLGPLIGYAQLAPTWAAVQRLSTAGAAAGSSAQQLAVAPDGSRVVSGQFNGSLIIGGTTLTAGTGVTHLYLARFTAAGALVWVRQAELTSSEYAAHVALDAAGNVYWAGFFEGRITFGDLTLNSPGAEVQDAFLVKYDAQGERVWNKTGGATSNSVHLNGVATDATGNVYVTGDFTGTVNFGSAPNQLTATSAAVFLYKFAANGNPLWVQQAGGVAPSYSYDLAVDGAGSVYLTGLLSGAATFGNTQLPATSTADDLFVAKYDAQSSVRWARRLALAGDDAGRTIAVNAAGEALVGGYADNRSAGTTGSEKAPYLTRLDANGAPLWAQRPTGTARGTSGIVGVSYDNRGGLYALGSFAGTLTLAGSTFTATAEKPFIARYDAQGAARWADAPVYSDAAAGSSFLDVATDASGTAYVAGTLLGAVSFGPIASAPTTSSADGFIARLNAGSVITSARGQANALALVAYPNPAAQYTTLDIPAGGGQLVVLDALGRRVRQQAVAAGRCQVSLVGLAPGLYQVRATLGNGQRAVTRLEVR